MSARDRTFPPRRLHVSELAHMSLSPAHFRAAYTDPRESTAAMDFGTAVHAELLGGQRIAVFDGATRRGKEWDAFEAANQDAIILKAPEYERVKRCAAAVRDNPVAAPYLEGRREVSLEWSAYGVDCGGRLDVIGDNFIADLKTTNLAQPDIFSLRALRMNLPAKMAWYERGAKEHGWKGTEVVLLAVESAPPYAVTVLRLTDRAREIGDKIVRRWIEQYRNCLASSTWPGYQQCVVPLDVPEAESMPDPEWVSE